MWISQLYSDLLDDMRIMVLEFVSLLESGGRAEWPHQAMNDGYFYGPCIQQQSFLIGKQWAPILV